MAVRTTPPKSRVSLDRSIERMRKQLTEFAPFLGKGKPTRSLEEFDLETERLIEDLLGQASNLLHAYEYAELGEAAGLVEITATDAAAGTCRRCWRRFPFFNPGARCPPRPSPAESSRPSRSAAH